MLKGGERVPVRCLQEGSFYVRKEYFAPTILGHIVKASKYTHSLPIWCRQRVDHLGMEEQPEGG